MIAVGSVVRYVLRKDQLPCNPGVVWTGVVLASSFHMLYVTILNNGYQDGKELVLVEQVVDVLTEQEYVAEGCW